MSKLKGKIDFTLFISVHNANPNGDPLNGNRPRINLDGYGEVQTMDADQKPMRFSKGETLFLPAGLGRCLIIGETELLKIRC